MIRRTVALVLVVDPVGFDPRQTPPTRRVDPGVVREMLATLDVFAVSRPPGTCIEGLR